MRDSDKRKKTKFADKKPCAQTEYLVHNNVMLFTFFCRILDIVDSFQNCIFFHYYLSFSIRRLLHVDKKLEQATLSYSNSKTHTVLLPEISKDSDRTNLQTLNKNYTIELRSKNNNQQIYLPTSRNSTLNSREFAYQTVNFQITKKRTRRTSKYTNKL